MCKTVVLIRKCKREFWDIGIVEVLCKTVASLLNQQLTVEIRYHDALHDFWAGQGTGSATLKAKLLQQLTEMKKAVLFEVFF